MHERRTNEERSRTTRARLVAAARRLFAEQGYDATSMTQVAKTAQVSTGALYHHWPTKPDLLAAVVTAIHHDLARTITRRARSRHDPLARLREAGEVFLTRCEDPEVARILLRDAPAVLGPVWIELDRRWWHGPTSALLSAAIDEGALVAADPSVLATALLGSLTALGRALADDPGTEESRTARATFATLIDGLRARAR